MVMQCWQMCQGALERGSLSDKCLGALRGTKCIPNKDRVLYPPEWLFFENQGLSAKFGEFLEKNVVPRQPMVERAFLAAGVQPLRTAVDVILLRTENPDDDSNTVLRLRERKTEIARVLFGSHMASEDLKSTLDRLERLKCKSATLLEFQFALSAFRRYLKSPPEIGAALYDPAEHLLWTTYLDVQTSFAPLARELASALCPEEDPGPFAAGLKEVLVADTPTEAANALNELGYAQLDTTDVVVPPSQKAVQQLGTDALINDEECPPHLVEVEPQLDITQEDDTENLETEDALRQPDISHAPTVSIPQSSGQTVPSRALSRTRAQHSGPKSQSNRHGTGARRKVPSGGRQEFFSYVKVRPDDEEESDQDNLSLQERMNLENKSINLILNEEPELERMPQNNPGFDLIQFGPHGRPVKWVEVKAMNATLDEHSVNLTRTQFEHAQKHGESYWLYIVENAATSEYTIIKIRDPAGKARRFTFDHGWRAVSGETQNGS